MYFHHKEKIILRSEILLLLMLHGRKCKKSKIIEKRVRNYSIFLLSIVILFLIVYKVI